MKLSRLYLILLIFVLSGCGDNGFDDTGPVFESGDTDRSAFRQADSMYIRSETHLGCRVKNFSYESENTGACIDDGIDPGFKVMIPQFIELPPGSKGFIDIPRAASKFVADSDNTTVAITFSAMAFVSSVEDHPLQVRVLVDGIVAEPGEITLTGGREPVTVSTSQSFTFITTVNAGIHTVQVQYSTQHIPDVNSYIRNASLKINTGFDRRDGDGLSGKGEQRLIEKNNNLWSPIPGSLHTFNMPENGKATITFSSVLKMHQGDFIMLRPIVNGGAHTLNPETVALAGRMYQTEARSATFNASDLPPGEHTIEFEWSGSLTDIVATADMYAWSVVVRTAVNDSVDSFFDVVSQNIVESSAVGPYKQVANLSTTVNVNEVSDIAVTFSGEIGGLGLVFIAPTFNGHPQTDQEVILYYPTIVCFVEQDPGCINPVAFNSGVASYTFGLKNIGTHVPGNVDIGVAYRVVQAGVGTEGSGIITKANLTVEKKTRVGPDLAIGPNMGRASKRRESIIEPVYGTRDLLAIIINPGILDERVEGRFLDEVDNILNSDFQSVRDYFIVVSGGRFIIEKADTLGIYEAENSGLITNGQNYYLDSSNFDCNDGAVYRSGSNALHAEALLQAENEFDFSAYDLNNDGRITPDELGIMVILPRESNTGSSIGMQGSPFCSNDPLVVSGIEITETVHMNMIYSPEGTPDDEKAINMLENMIVAAHELGHHYLDLDDLYGRYLGIHDGETFTQYFGNVDQCKDDEGPGEMCQFRYVNTAPHMISLMAYKSGRHTTSTHLNGFHKLHLGWVLPSILQDDGSYELADVKLSEDVFILPRRHDDGREYVLLETRYRQAQINTSLYDYNIRDSGLAVYHVIEPGHTCKSPFGAAAPDCRLMIPPVCVDLVVWSDSDKHASNFARLGLRLIQPDLSHVWDDQVYENEADFTEFEKLLFGDFFGQDLMSSGMLDCPNNIGDRLPPGSEPLLLWVDEDPSGYNLLDITTSHPNVTFELVID